MPFTRIVVWPPEKSLVDDLVAASVGLPAMISPATDLEDFVELFEDPPFAIGVLDASTQSDDLAAAIGDSRRHEAVLLLFGPRRLELFDAALNLGAGLWLEHRPNRGQWPWWLRTLVAESQAKALATVPAEPADRP